jgi:hypothetical protein
MSRAFLDVVRDPKQTLEWCALVDLAEHTREGLRGLARARIRSVARLATVHRGGAFDRADAPGWCRGRRGPSDVWGRTGRALGKPVPTGVYSASRD